MKFEQLGNIVEIRKGKKPVFTVTPDENSVRVLQIDDLRNDLTLKYSDDKNGVCAEEEDVLIVWDGANAGTIGFGKKGFIGSTIALMKKKEKEKYSTIFIGKFLQSKFDFLRSKTTGATIPHINGKVLRSLEIPILPFESQIQIATILSKAETLIEQRKESIQLLNEFLKSCFLEMFGEPMKNEKGWDTINFNKLAIIDRTQALPSEFTKEDIYLGLEDIEKETGNIFKTSLENAEELKSSKFRFTSNHVLYGKLRPYLNKVAFPKTEGICSTDIFPIKPLQNISNKYFVGYLMRSNYFVKQMTLKTVGANLPRASSDAIQNLKVYKPPIALQTQFAQLVEKTESLKQQYKNSLVELENLYGALSQKAFKGELEFSKEVARAE